MLSIIVSSLNEINFNEFKDSLHNTIGIEYQLIRIPNKEGKKSLCQVYNEGAENAHYPHLLFIHEDVQFITQDWGSKLILHFSRDLEMGLIGVVGCQYKSKVPSSWWQPEIKGFQPIRGSMVQHYKKANSATINYQYNPNNLTIEEVVSVDGVFLAMSKHTWQSHNFDEKLLTKFHGYDLDMCLNIGQTQKIGVAHDIQIEHFSEGVFKLDWFEENVKVHEKWAPFLPKTVNKDITKKMMDGINPQLILENLSWLYRNSVHFTYSWSLMKRIISLCFQPSTPKFWIWKTRIWPQLAINTFKIYLKKLKSEGL